jgi:hypothetical protein
MMKRITVAATAMTLAVGGLVGGAAQSAGAAKPPPFDAVGSVTCGAPGSGKAKISPPFSLTPGVGTRTTTSKLKTTCTGTTGNPAVTPTSAKINSTSLSDAAGTCITLSVGGEAATDTNVDISWKAAGGKINPTHIHYTTILGGVPAHGFTLPGPTGLVTVTGSYAGNSAISTVLIADTTEALTALCTPNAKGKIKGIKKLTFGSGGSLVIAP